MTALFIEEDEEEKRPNEERKYLEEQLKRLSDVSAACRDTSKVDELCKLTGSMIELYKALRLVGNIYDNPELLEVAE